MPEILDQNDPILTPFLPLICDLARNSLPKSTIFDVVGDLHFDPTFAPYMRFGMKFCTKIDQNRHKMLLHMRFGCEIGWDFHAVLQIL